MSKLTDKEIADLKKAISETKETFEDSHLGEKKVTLDQIKDLEERVQRDNNEINPMFDTERFIANQLGQQISQSIDREMWGGTGILRTASAQSSTVIGGQVTDGSNTLFLISTAEMRQDRHPMGSGITTEYTITARVRPTPFEVDRNTRYELYFNGGDRIYRGYVTIERIEQDTQGLIATMKVIGALNITES